MYFSFHNSYASTGQISVQILIDMDESIIMRYDLYKSLWSTGKNKYINIKEKFRKYKWIQAIPYKYSNYLL